MIVIHAVLAFAFVAVVPLAFRLLTSPHSVLGRVAQRAHPIAAAGAVGSLVLTQGVAAAALASVWSIFCAALSIDALAGLKRRPRTVSIALEVIALGYLTFGSAWFLLSRAGVRPLDFPDVVVELTAVHFHYAGFASVVLAITAARQLPRGELACLLGGAGAVVATGLIAAGISFSPTVEDAGVTLISLSLTMVAVATLRGIRGVAAPTRAGWLLGVSSISVLVSMALALQFAMGLVEGWPLDIPTMARTHGIINALGFVLCGVLGWRLVLGKVPNG